ncbi:cell division protein FtsB [Aliidiomarina sedimenti]|uniref:Cell division protein FtsB n=1 Tax=Aliidiomarina sedimenti TaxID=1933879 RepID=A0ABY0C2D2_9GAMM|nr:cell division protein FtsB [Aliidiomarina sedimenti]RUO31957.1 cell division protein FtsB [Aliidiomarina sedimenti]
MRLLTLITLALLLALQYRFWAGDNGLAELHAMQQDIERQQASNEQLEQRNQLLRADIHDLRNAQEAVEEFARNELGLIKEDETFFRLVRLQPDESLQPVNSN